MDFLVAVSFVVACIWVWRVVALRLGRKDNGWFVRHFVGSSAGFFAGFCVFTLAIALGVISPEKKESAQDLPSKDYDAVALNELKEPEASDAIVAKEKTLGVTLEVYADRMNKILKSADIKHRVSTKKIVRGSVNDSLNFRVSQFTSLVVTISKTSGEVLAVTLIGSGDGTPSSGFDVMMVASAALNAAVPAMKFEEVFTGLSGLLDGQERVHGSVKLSASKIDQMGTFFFAEPA